MTEICADFRPCDRPDHQDCRHCADCNGLLQEHKSATSSSSKFVKMNRHKLRSLYPQGVPRPAESEQAIIVGLNDLSLVLRGLDTLLSRVDRGPQWAALEDAYARLVDCQIVARGTYASAVRWFELGEEQR